MDAAGIMSTLEDRGLIIRCDLDADGTAHMLDLASAPGSDALTMAKQRQSRSPRVDDVAL